MRIGVSYRRDWAPSGLPEYAKKVEQLGFDELWVVEDCFYASGIASATAALATTSKLSVGLGIMPAVARNPVFTAMEIATIAAMFPGRFTPGIGHGVKRWMQQLGAFPKSQMTALEDAAIITKQLLAGEVVNYEGKQFQLDNGVLVHPPSQVPPVYLGVRGPKSLGLSGRIADGTILAEFSSPAYVEKAKKYIENGMHGQAKSHQITVFVFSSASESKDVGREQVRPLVANAIASGRKDMYFTPLTALENIQGLRAIEDTAALAARIPDEWIDQMALIGNKNDWKQTLEEFSDAGVDTVVLVPLRGTQPTEIEKFAKSIRYLLPFPANKSD